MIVKRHAYLGVIYACEIHENLGQMNSKKNVLGCYENTNTCLFSLSLSLLKDWIMILWFSWRYIDIWEPREPCMCLLYDLQTMSISVPQFVCVCAFCVYTRIHTPCIHEHSLSLSLCAFVCFVYTHEYTHHVYMSVLCPSFCVCLCVCFSVFFVYLSVYVRAFVLACVCACVHLFLCVQKKEPQCVYLCVYLLFPCVYRHIHTFCIHTRIYTHYIYTHTHTYTQRL